MNKIERHEVPDMRNHPARLLWAAFIVCALLAAGCAHQQPAPPPPPADMKSLVRQVISDPARADKVLALMEQLDGEMGAQMKANVDLQNEFMRLNADYNAAPGQFQQHQSAAAAARDKARARIFDTYFQLKALTTKEEWDALSKPGKQAMTNVLERTTTGPSGN